MTEKVFIPKEGDVLNIPHLANGRFSIRYWEFDSSVEVEAKSRGKYRYYLNPTPASVARVRRCPYVVTISLDKAFRLLRQASTRKENGNGMRL